MEILASLPERLREDAADIRIGVSAKCAFLPTVADVMKWAEAETARRSQFVPHRPSMSVIRADDTRLTPDEIARRKEAVKATLGYDPMRVRGETRVAAFTPRPIDEIIAEGVNGAPPSDELLAVMRKAG